MFINKVWRVELGYLFYYEKRERRVGEGLIYIGPGITGRTTLGHTPKALLSYTEKNTISINSIYFPQHRHHQEKYST
jgi:hypothetical protein